MNEDCAAVPGIKRLDADLGLTQVAEGMTLTIEMSNICLKALKAYPAVSQPMGDQRTSSKRSCRVVQEVVRQLQQSFFCMCHWFWEGRNVERLPFAALLGYLIVHWEAWQLFFSAQLCVSVCIWLCQGGWTTRSSWRVALHPLCCEATEARSSWRPQWQCHR